MQPAELTLDLDGTVALRAGDGGDLAPRGAMLRGVLVVLGLSPGLRCSRETLRGLLWADRQPEQAAASLRRSLSDLRRAMRPHEATLLSGPGWVGLDASRVRVSTPATPDLLAADLALRAPAFNRWLDARRGGGPAPARAGGRALAVTLPDPGAGGHPACDLILREACARAGRYLRLVVLPPEVGAGTDALSLGCIALAGDGDTLTVEVSSWARDAAPWSAVRRAGPEALPRAVRDLSAELARHLMGPADGILADLMSYDWPRIERAMAVLGEDGPLKDEVRIALAGFGRFASWVDRFAGDEAREEARSTALRAWRAAPTEPVVCAAAALVLGNLGEVDLAATLAERGRALDGANAFARYASATVRARTGRHREARDEAESIVLEDLAGVPDETASMAAAAANAACGDAARALGWARRAWLIAPTSRPALRFVSALAYRAGDEAMAAAALRALKIEEPGFTAAAMAEKDYPVTTLREAGLLDVAWARHLGGARRGLSAQRRGGGG